MPSPSTPRRTATRRDGRSPPKTKPIEVGIPLGVYDTNSVRDRVRQWQSQGGGVIPAPEVYVEDIEEQETASEETMPKREKTIKSSKSKSENNDAGDSRASNRRAGGRSIKADEDGGSRNRSGSAPAKRVISDAHWRMERSPPANATSSKASRDIPPKRIISGDGIRVRPIPNAKIDTRRKKEADKKPPKKDSVGLDDGIRVYSTPSESKKKSAESLKKSPVEEGACKSEKGIDVETPKSKSSVSDTAGSTEQPGDEYPRVESSAARLNGRRRKSGHQKEKPVRSKSSSGPNGFSEARGSTKSATVNLLSHVFGEPRKIFAKPQTSPPAVATKVPTIEAWLNQTSDDPFMDDYQSTIRSLAPSEAPEPSEPQELPESPEPSVTKPQKVTGKKTPVEDANKIWESLSRKTEDTGPARRASKRRTRLKSLAIYEENHFPVEVKASSSPTRPANGATPTKAKAGSLPPEPINEATPTKAMAGSSRHESLNEATPTPASVGPVPASPGGSPISLKRRGAKRSISPEKRDRRKSIIRNEAVADISPTSSLLSTSSVEPPDPKYPLRPPGLDLKRPFPSTGQHRLSTIASVETFHTQENGAPAASISELSESTIQPLALEGDKNEGEARDKFDPNSLYRTKSRLTKHADLISVLSIPRAGNKSIVSARSIRTNRSRLATATIGDLLKELASDESKYMRELHTLVDGVIPVLLNCVLSKSDSAVAAGLFRPSSKFNDEPSFTRPIVDMGIEVERLKALHKRIPLDNVNELLTWTQGAQQVYKDYLRAWRMGFQDVVVNLAPAAEEDSQTLKPVNADTSGADEGLPLNKDGDVVDANGQRVDVAFLLKRPLVRLKYISKTLKGINFISPSAEAEKLAKEYQSLVVDARNRFNEERARLEDEAAANIDASRARDPRTLVPLKGVRIDKNRHVRARDHFNLALLHSSGQCIDCHVELLLRDPANGLDTGGDLLICEVDGNGRWLLFPPLQTSRVSARNGDRKGEIVIMIRGFGANGMNWQELFYLRTEDEQAGFEWVQMLGLIPVPPKIMRSHSFISRQSRKKSSPEPTSSSLEPPATPSSPAKSRTPSPREVEIPIGEQAHPASKPWSEPPVETDRRTPPAAPPKDTPKTEKKLPRSPPRTPTKSPHNYVDEVNDLRSLPSQASSRRSENYDQTQPTRSFVESLGSIMGTSPTALKRSKAKRISKHSEKSPSSPKSRADSSFDNERPASSTPTKDTSDSKPATSPVAENRSPSPEPRLDSSSCSRKSVVAQRKDSRPSHERTSSAPSLDLPTIPKMRRNNSSDLPVIEPDEEPQWEQPSEPVLPTNLSKKRSKPLKEDAETSFAPPTPPHRSASPAQLKGSKTPVLPGKTSRNEKRRSSSPLKHEYEPSTASESSSESEADTVEHNDATSVSDSSSDEELEMIDVPALLPLGVVDQFNKVSPPGSLYSLPNGTLAPSQSASQAPYKTVPPQPTKASKTIASIFSWSDKGMWESLHPTECSIVITPGLIEAFEMSDTHSKITPLSSPTPVVDADAFSDLSSNLITPDVAPTEQPLIGLELTPLVPLRRGTALDISIRSPPTSKSQIRSGNNIMFRSRNPEECEALYALINHSRINNPTYVALQNARGPYVPGSSFTPILNRRNSTGGSVARSSSWWGGSWGGSSGYRATSRATSAASASIAPTESSIGTMASAFSALKRFGKGGTGFNIARSTISSRNASRSNSIYTSSDNSSGDGTSSPIPPGGEASKVAPIGISNAKIRLYVRETGSRWRDMGSARLTIMRPSTPPLTPGENPRPHSRWDEKRIVINGKTKGEVLLDEQLGESCFERVARTGIAVSVWEDVVGPSGELGTVGAVGGVGGGRATVYMIQVCHYVFGPLPRTKKSEETYLRCLGG